MIRVTRLLEQRVDLTQPGGGDGPARDAHRVWNERASLLLVLEDSASRVGLGEAAPLLGYSPDSTEESWSALAPLVGTSLRDGSHTAAELRALTESVASAAARFALESALVDVWSRDGGEPAWALLTRLSSELAGGDDGEPLADSVRPVAALLPSGVEAALVHAEKAFARGIRCFKVKIGAPRAWTEELATLRAVRRTFPAAKLRVDANQALSPEELWQRLPALRDLRLEWLEEPTASFPRGIDWEVGIPLALDESLQREPMDPATARSRGVSAFVLKPTTLGGYLRSLELARGARAAGIDAVASHVYEGPIGFSAVAALALALGAGRPADGLDHHAGVAGAGALPALDTEHGRVRAWNEPGFGLTLAALLERRPPVRELGS